MAFDADLSTPPMVSPPLTPWAALLRPALAWKYQLSTPPQAPSLFSPLPFPWGGLTTQPHPHPYHIQWLNDSEKVKVTQTSRVSFSIGSYDDSVDYDVVPMQACSFLLGRPWEYENNATHHGRSNKYTFVHKGKKITLLPLTPAEIVKDKRERAANAKKELDDKSENPQASDTASPLLHYGYILSSIPSYHGVDSDAYIEWEKGLDHIFAQCHMCERRKLRNVTSALIGSALIWWENLSMSSHDNLPRTWDDMKVLIREIFVNRLVVPTYNDDVHMLEEQPRAVPLACDTNI
uniref:Retrotransposon gag domain-containing protein n=1 Tax=Leersia perrieri TaxID=77586 RepID=A0A0D9W2E7_9ORYZ